MDRYYSYKISPEVIQSDLVLRPYIAGKITDPVIEDPCCSTTGTPITTTITGYAFNLLSMRQVVSGGTNGTSLMTGLTIPILLTQNTVDIGYYSVFDGIIQQKDFFTNFVFSGSNINQYQVFVTNTSSTEKYKFLEFSNYILDWGDGTTQVVNNTNPFVHSHIYPTIPRVYTISMSGISPWNINIVQKTIHLPYTIPTITNLNGTASFIPLGGSWSGTPIMYDYLYSGDSICDTEAQASYNFTNVPFLITGSTRSRINDLAQYGPKSGLLNGKFKPNIEVVGSSGVIGTVSGETPEYISYIISGITYLDFRDGRTIFFVESSGITSDSIICSALTKNEVLLNVISETQVQSNIFIERGKFSPLENVIRLGEVDNYGDLEKYGYKFFNILNT